MKENKSLIYGVGTKDADYVVQKIKSFIIDGEIKQRQIWICPYYIVWQNMLRRCYSVSYKKRWPSYEDCYVCPEWLTFSNFKQWMQEQDCDGKQLDKDLLIRGNKVYSPETCCFISHNINLFILESTAKRGKWPIGVSWSKRDNTYHAKCSNPFTKKIEYLGMFDTPSEAHEAWLSRKLEFAKLLAKEIVDDRIAQALVGRYENYVES